MLVKKSIASFCIFFIKRKIFSFIIVLILINSIALLVLYNTMHELKHPLVHQILVGKAINAIEFVNEKSIAERKSAVEAMSFAYSAFGATVTDKPHWRLRLTSADMPHLREILLKEKEPLSISFLLSDNKWLNVHIYRFTHSMHTRFLIFLTAEIFITVGLLLFTWSSNRYTHPIATFKEAVEKIGTDMKSPLLISLQGPEIVREAAQAVVNAQQRIHDLIASRTRMLAAISHDLRTPITRMILRAEFITQTDLQASFIENLDEMNKMITEILAFAKIDAKTGKKSPCDLVSLLGVVCDDACDMGWDVIFTTDLHRLPFIGHALSLKRAFTNLLDNATRYGKKAQVRLYRSLNAISITITDEGPGIPVEEREHVFLPFQRGVNENARDNTGGTGLGLAIAYDIIQAHHGTITLTNLSPKGLQVKIKFPKSEMFKS